MDSSDADAPPEEKDWEKKRREYEAKKARAKALRMRLTCTICGARPKTLLNCPCGTTQYCSTECQRIDWRDRGHRAACKKIRNERAAPTRPPSPPREVVYGPAPRSHADEARARIAAEHEAARARREANPEPEPTSSRCPICFEDFDVNVFPRLCVCCCRLVCKLCEDKIGRDQPCALCRTPAAEDWAEHMVRLRRHVENDVPLAIHALGRYYAFGTPPAGIVENPKKAAKIWKRAVELGNLEAMVDLGDLYHEGGEGVKVNRKKAMQLYRMAADRGHARGQCMLGESLIDDATSALSTEFREARRLFTLSASQGFAESEYQLGFMYEEAWGVNRDLDEAKRRYAIAAAQRSTPPRKKALERVTAAIAARERLLELGTALTVENLRYLHELWYCKSMTASEVFTNTGLDSKEMVVLACMYDEIYGDREKAKAMFRIAADVGLHPKAQYEYGLMLEVEADGYHQEGDHDYCTNLLELSFDYFMDSATQGYGAIAEFAVANRYKLGLGVRKDLDEAKRWYARAVANGHQAAKLYLEELDA
jgi:TPR repeat protein